MEFNIREYCLDISARCISVVNHRLLGVGFGDGKKKARHFPVLSMIFNVSAKFEWCMEEYNQESGFSMLFSNLDSHNGRRK